MRVSNYRCEARARTTPAGKWTYWIFDGHEPIESSTLDFSSEAEALRAGHDLIEQIERKKRGQEGV
jgi:hypothetical protein